MRSGRKESESHLRDNSAATAPTTMQYSLCYRVFNLIVNDPIIIITPRNHYCRNAQSSNRIIGHYSPPPPPPREYGRTTAIFQGLLSGLSGSAVTAIYTMPMTTTLVGLALGKIFISRLAHYNAMNT